MGDLAPRHKRSRSLAPLLKAISTTLTGEEFPVGSECWMRGPEGAMVGGTILSSPQFETGRCVVRLANGVCVQAHRSQLVAAESHVNLLEEVPRSLGLSTKVGEIPSAFELSPGTRCILDQGTLSEGETKKPLMCVVATSPNEDGRCVVRMEHGYTGTARACRLVHAAQLTPVPTAPAVVTALFGSTCSGRSAPASSSESSENEFEDDDRGRTSSAKDEQVEEAKQEPINSEASTPKSYYAPEDDENYSAYYKMLKVGTPAPAVAHRMLRDGRDPRRIAATEPFAGPPAGEAPFVSAPKARARPPKRRATVKQLPLDFFDSVAENSIWADVQMLNGIRVHRQELEDLFVQPAGSPSQQGNSDGKSSKSHRRRDGHNNNHKKTSNRNNIDPVALSRKRATNVAIALAGGKLQALRPKFVRRALRQLEIGAFDRAQLEALLAAAPTADEVQKLQAALAKRPDIVSSCRDSFATFAEAERFMFRVPLRLGLRHYYRTVHSLKFCETLDERVSSLTEETTALGHASQLAQSSARFKKVLTYILKISDELKDAKQLEFHSPKTDHNDAEVKSTDEERPSASGFRIASLLRLHELKAFDRRTSALDFVVGLIVKNQDQQPLALEEELKTKPLTQGARVTMSACTQELKVLQNGLDRLRRLVHKEDDGRPLSDDTSGIRLDDPNWNSEALSSDSETEEDVIDSDALEFYELAEVRVNDAKVQLEEAVAAFESTLEYFGEDPSMTPNEFFSTLVVFVDKFVEARTKQANIKPSAEDRAKKRVLSIDAKLAAMASQTAKPVQATPPRIRRANTANSALEAMLQSRVGVADAASSPHVKTLEKEEPAEKEAPIKNAVSPRRSASASKLEAMLLARTGGLPPKPKLPQSELPPRPPAIVPQTQGVDSGHSLTIEITNPEVQQSTNENNDDDDRDEVPPLPPTEDDEVPMCSPSPRRISTNSVSDDDLDLEDIRDIALY